MLIQAVIYGVLIVISLLGVVEAIRSCCRDEDTKKTARIWSAPVEVLKNKIKGMKTLKEEATTPATPAQPEVTVQTV